MNTLFCDYLNFTERQVESTDNFFTSVNLAKTLRQQAISIVEIVNCIRKEILQEIKKIKKDLYTTKVFKHDGCTLTVYQAKTTKKVLLLSTMHLYC